MADLFPEIDGRSREIENLKRHMQRVAEDPHELRDRLGVVPLDLDADPLRRRRQPSGAHAVVPR